MADDCLRCDCQVAGAGEDPPGRAVFELRGSQMILASQARPPVILDAARIEAIEEGNYELRLRTPDGVVSLSHLGEWHDEVRAALCGAMGIK